MTDKIWILAFLMLIGCKTVEKSNSSTSQSSSESLTELTAARDTTSIVTSSSRSMDTDIKQHVSGKLVIYPRGEFTLSQDGTFKGQADSVVSNQTKVLQESRSQQDTLQEAQSHGSQNAGERTSAKSDESEIEDSSTERKPNLIPWIGAALGIIIVVIGLHLYFRR